MDNLENGSLTTETTETGSPASEVIQGSPEATPASGKQPVEQPTAQEILDYQKDERLKRMWMSKEGKFDPNLMYKSVRSGDDIIEKQFKPLKAQAETFTKFLKEYGYEPNPDKLKPEFDELKSWRDPENPVVKRGKFLSFFMDDPEFKPEVEAFLETMRKKGVRREFGEGVSDEVVKEILDSRKFREEYEAKEKARVAAEQHTQLLGSINDGWGKVQKKAKEIGFPVTDDIRVRLLEHCAKEGTSPKDVYPKFLELYEEEIEKYKRLKWQSDNLKTKEKIHKTGIIPAGSMPSKGITQAVKPIGKTAEIVNNIKDRLGLNT